jgi:hypothetical protein
MADYDGADYECYSDAPSECYDCDDNCCSSCPLAQDDWPEPEKLPGGECEFCGEQADHLYDDDGELVCEECYYGTYNTGPSVAEEHAAERRQMGLINF